ncbi:uncharacterized protein LOC116805715 [Drosophila grimshawi]|uniref:uncharacterized protein LOC116805715 n=1 Tax=Drosophila grimshawi TaxID=7222 RepID=UPI000C86F0BB|nr:uncharacterized protein LOC116805715 [Drosophila grimshawi]
MPPFCCGGRRCAADIRRRQEVDGGLEDEQTGTTASSPITVSSAEYPLTLKFYARHDWPYFNCTDEDVRRMREVLDKKGAAEDATTEGDAPKRYVPKHATAQPMTENQIYGWYQHRAYRYLKKDRGIFVFPREGDPLIKVIQASKWIGR